MRQRASTILRRASLVVITLVAIFNVQLRGARTCRACLSSQGWSQWRVGIWPASIPLLPEMRTDVQPSHYARSFAPDHDHDWKGGGHAAYVLFGTVTHGFSCGGCTPTLAAHNYESSPEYRSFIHEKLRRGELTEEQVRRLVLADAAKQEPAEREVESRLFDEYLEQESAAGRL
jgi:hypothetical protein